MTSPDSFMMIDHSGRARTYQQRANPDVEDAVAACPVSCMHNVSFDELKGLEKVRDQGINNGSNDQRHFGYSNTRGYIAPTPLHVSRRDSDSNHKSSYYQLRVLYCWFLVQSYSFCER